MGYKLMDTTFKLIIVSRTLFLLFVHVIIMGTSTRKSPKFKFILTICLLLLLLCCGDVAENPGPIFKLKTLIASHTNIRGLVGKMCAVKTTLCNHSDVITLSETFLSHDTTVDLRILGFHEILRRDRPTFGGGLAILVKESIPHKRRLDLETNDIEIM